MAHPLGYGQQLANLAIKGGQYFGEWIDSRPIMGLLEGNYDEVDRQLREELQANFLGDMSKGQLPSFGLGGLAGATKKIDIYDLGNIFTVLENPTKSELSRMAAKQKRLLKESGLDAEWQELVSKEPPLRTLQAGDNTYAWPAMSGLHNDIAERLLDSNTGVRAGSWDPMLGFLDGGFLEHSGY